MWKKDTSNITEQQILKLYAMSDCTEEEIYIMWISMHSWHLALVIVRYSLLRNISSICFSVSVFLPEMCDEVLASPLPYSAFTSSSVLAADFGAGYAKLNRRVGEEELYGCV